MGRCQVIINSWTFCGLVGAFLDLAITYFLLCCSTITYFIATFLSLFGLTLPCPCNGLFGYAQRGPCLQRFLVDYPIETNSSLQLSVKSKFPFDAIFGRNDHSQLNLKLVKERKLDDEGQQYDGEAVYSSFSDPRRSQQSFSGSDSIGKFDVKGKGVASQKPRCGPLRRRRRGSVDYGKFTSGSSYDHMRTDRGILRSPSGPAKLGNELYVERSKPVNSHGKTVSEFDSNDVTDEGKFMYGDASPKYLESMVRHGNGIDGADENAFRILEQALEEEHAARVAMYSELEQERIAAATAADEAMAMILRLQEEKAAIEMEARQYQRILEEKSSYDAEEMDILKEIIVRREREKHFLEKEVETYQKLLQEDEESVSQVDGEHLQNDSPALNSSVDTMQILQQLSESIDRRGSIQSKSDYPVYACTSVDDKAIAEPLGEEPLITQWNDGSKIIKELESSEGSSDIPVLLQSTDENNQDIQEKVMLSVEDVGYPQFSKAISTNEGRISDNYHIQKSANTKGEKQTFTQVREPQVQDVHIISSNSNVFNQSTGKGGSGPLIITNDASPVLRTSESSFEASRELEISRCRSDIVDRLLSESTSARRVAPDLRRNSLPVVDYERLKIDNEVEWLRTRLRAVQEEKERLKPSLEPQGRGKAELQLLEDIASQIREIRQLTEPEKAGRQGGLPPLSSKVTAKRRRSRSITAEVAHSQSS